MARNKDAATPRRRGEVGWLLRLCGFISLVLLWLTGCSTPRVATPTRANPVVYPTFTTRELPVTYTPIATAMPITPTPLPPPTSAVATDTPIPFDKTVVELRYTIPALGLERRLQGNISGQIIFFDETTSAGYERSNQTAVLLELQQVLPTLTLSPPPTDCPDCVLVSYSLPLSAQSGEGWLQEPTLLASIENIMAVTLGAHFPPQTVVGLRRSASAYAPAQTIALTADGQLWLWLATEGQIAPPLTGETAVSPLLSALANTSTDTLRNSYVVNCAGGPPIETLYLLSPNTAAPYLIDIGCPEFALPTTLLPLYLALDDPLATKLATLAGPPRPPAALPLAGLLDYRRPDGARLTLYADGRAVVQMAGTAVYSTTLLATDILSLTNSLTQSGLLQPGLTSFQNSGDETATPTWHLLVRTADGVLDARWSQPLPIPAAQAALDILEAWVEAGMP